MAASFSGLLAAASPWASSCFSSGHLARYAACRYLRISSSLGRCIIFNCYFPLPFYVWPGFYFYGICSRYGRVIFKFTVCYLIFRAVTFHFAGYRQAGYNVAGYPYSLHFRTRDWVPGPCVDIVFIRVRQSSRRLRRWARRLIRCRLWCRLFSQSRGHNMSPRPFFHHLFIWSMDTEWDLR